MRTRRHCPATRRLKAIHTFSCLMRTASFCIHKTQANLSWENHTTRKSSLHSSGNGLPRKSDQIRSKIHGLTAPRRIQALKKVVSSTKQPARGTIGRSQMAERAIPHIAGEAIRPVVDLVDANIERSVRLEEERGVTTEVGRRRSLRA